MKPAAQGVEMLINAYNDADSVIKNSAASIWDLIRFAKNEVV
jgi:hypothetical protein